MARATTDSQAREDLDYFRLHSCIQLIHDMLADDGTRMGEIEIRAEALPAPLNANASDDCMDSVLRGETTTDEFRELLPKLFPEMDLYEVQGEALVEQSAANLSCLGLYWLCTSKYEEFAGEEEPRLSRNSFRKLVDFVGLVNLNDGVLHAAMAYLCLRGLGNSQQFVRACQASAVASSAEGVVLHALRTMPRLLPSVKQLKPRQKTLLMSALEINRG